MTVSAQEPTDHEARLARRRHRLLVLRRLDVVSQRRAQARRRRELAGDGETGQPDQPAGRRSGIA